MKIDLDKLHTRDVFILNIFNQKIKCSFLDKIMPPITYLGSLTFSVLICFITLLIKNEKIHDFAISMIISLAFSAAVTQILKKKANRIRPFLKVENLYIKKIGIDDYSFPSGHTCAAFSMATISGLYFPGFSFLFISLGFLVGVSRMYLGVHYPTDVGIGIIIGSLSSLLTFTLGF